MHVGIGDHDAACGCHAQPAVERLIAITRAEQEARAATLDWLRTEFGVATPGQRLADYAALTSDAFVAEVRKRRGQAGGGCCPRRR